MIIVHKLDLIIRLWKPDVKTGCCCIYENRLIWEPGEFENFLITWPVLISPKKYNYIWENRSGSHNIMREPEPARSHKTSKSRPTLVSTVYSSSKENELNAMKPSLFSFDCRECSNRSKSTTSIWLIVAKSFLLLLLMAAKSLTERKQRVRL
jgi:hypothetical protein